MCVRFVRGEGEMCVRFVPGWDGGVIYIYSWHGPPVHLEEKVAWTDDAAARRGAARRQLLDIQAAVLAKLRAYERNHGPQRGFKGVGAPQGEGRCEHPSAGALGSAGARARDRSRRRHGAAAGAAPPELGRGCRPGAAP